MKCPLPLPPPPSEGFAGKAPSGRNRCSYVERSTTTTSVDGGGALLERRFPHRLSAKLSFSGERGGIRRSEVSLRPLESEALLQPSSNLTALASPHERSALVSDRWTKVMKCSAKVRSASLTEVEVQFLPVAEVGIGGDARLALLPDYLERWLSSERSLILSEG
jgi:hypothetical protein